MEYEGKSGNPYMLMYGKEPRQMIERPDVFMEIVETFSSSDDPSTQLYLLTGVRGIGKTVMMNSIASFYQNEEDWIVVKLTNTTTDMVAALVSKLKPRSKAKGVSLNAKVGVSVMGVNVQIERNGQSNDMGDKLTNMLEKLQRKEKKVLVTIDEICNTENIKDFINTFSTCVYAGLPIFLLATGIPENIYELEHDKGFTFLGRAQRIWMKPLSMTAIAESYLETFDISVQEADEMAALTKGYPFAFQILGFHTWRKGGDYKAAFPIYKQYLYEYAYNKLWPELSEYDKKVCYAIAKVGTGKVMDARMYLGTSHSQFGTYRDRLIRKGIVTDKGYGRIELALPFFGDYAVSKFEERY